MTVQINKCERVPFPVDEVAVTEENMEEVAEWCQGEIRVLDSGEKYIKVRVHRPQGPRQTQAFPGDHILYVDTGGYKVYTDKAFQKSFRTLEESTDDPGEKLLREIFEEPAQG